MINKIAKNIQNGFQEDSCRIARYKNKKRTLGPTGVIRAPLIHVTSRILAKEGYNVKRPKCHAAISRQTQFNNIS